SALSCVQLTADRWQRRSASRVASPAPRRLSRWCRSRFPQNISPKEHRAESICMRRKFVAGNWKMNTDRSTGPELAKAIAAGVPASCGIDVLVAPPFPYLLPVGDAVAGSGVLLGGQNASSESPGAFTGEVAIE